MSDVYIKVTTVPRKAEASAAADETAEPAPEIIELPVEETGGVLVTTLSSQFTDAIGLQYRNEESGALRALRIKDDAVEQPGGGWGDRTYFVVIKKKDADLKRTADSAQLDAPAVDEKASRLYIGNLPFTLTGSEPLKAFFEGAKEIVVPTHMDTGKIKGYGYIIFEDVEKAEACIKEKQGIEIQGRQIRLDYAPYNKPFNKRNGPVVQQQSTGESEACKRIWVGNLPFTIKGEEELKQHFAGAESIVVPVHMDTGKVKGFAYVTFPTVEAATAAKEGAQSLELHGRMVRVDYAPFGGGPRRTNGGPYHGGGGGGYGGACTS